MISVCSTFLKLLPLLLLVGMGSSDSLPDKLIKCLSDHSDSNRPISEVTYFPENSSYTSTLQSYVRNLRFNSSTTPKPLFIVAPTHVSHIQASIVCCKTHGIEMRIRSGGHDYDGLSYVSPVPFMILDTFNLRAISVDIEHETAWVESGATVGELYYRIAEKSRTHAFPAGVCPTVCIGGHFSGGGYGNLMRKFGLSVDNVIDAQMVDANGLVLNRESMGEDLFWAIRGGGGASFGVIVSWKIKLVPVPEMVTVFRVEKTIEEGATEIVHKWQYVADKIHQDLFIRIVLMAVHRKSHQTAKAKLVALFLGDAEELVAIMHETLPELGLSKEQCFEMSWIDSTLYWYNYPQGTALDVLLERQPKSEKFLKKKSDYVQQPIPKSDIEGLMRKLETWKVALTFNPYGGKMSEISELETPFPHRAGNIYKIQYSVNWKEQGDDAADRCLDMIRKLYDYMTPFVSNSPRSSYLNYRDVDIGTNDASISYEKARIWGAKYFKGNFDQLVQVKTMVDPTNFFRYEQSVPSLAYWKNALP